MSAVRCQMLNSDAEGIARAGAILQEGGLVAFPTETVYGLGVRADDSGAVARLYAAKGRPSFNPLIVHVPESAAVEALVDMPDAARDLAMAFWPGALTFVLPLKHPGAVSSLVTAGLPTLAVRIPDHPVAQGVLRAADVPIAAPSANLSGQVSPTTAQHVADGLGDKIDAIVDGGACPVGVESTILGFDPGPVLLRPGGLPIEVIEAALGQSVARATGADPSLAPDAPSAPTAPNAPGQLASHYAPSGTVRLNVTTADGDEVLLGFGDVEEAAFNLSPTGDLTQAAARLFDLLHQLDAMGAKRIAVSPIPETGLGAAINDRLRRAAAPR